MASENIGALYPTKIPGYEDAADIQAALRLYHYGEYDYNKNNENLSQLPADSIAGHLKAIQDDVAVIDARGIGSDFTPTQPTNVPDGYIWVDADSAPVGFDGNFAGKQWVLHDSGSLVDQNGFSATALSGDAHYILIDAVIATASISNTSLKTYINLTPEEFREFEIDETVLPAESWNYKTAIKIELANTSSQFKILSQPATSNAKLLSFLSPISSLSFELGQPQRLPSDPDRILPTVSPTFNSGTYQLWSYK